MGRLIRGFGRGSVCSLGSGLRGIVQAGRNVGVAFRCGGGDLFAVGLGGGGGQGMMLECNKGAGSMRSISSVLFVFGVCGGVVRESLPVKGCGFFNSVIGGRPVEGSRCGAAGIVRSDYEC